jgi:hypothetical protein
MALLYGKTVTGDYVVVQVTADGQIVSVTDSTGLTVSWDSVTGKPTVFPSDWSIIQNIPSTFPSAWGDISGKPTTFPSDWSIISSKPTDFPTTWSLVTETPETFPCTWLELQDKPTTFPSDWDTTADKPATFPSDWDTTADKPTTFPSAWADISDKPTTFPSTWDEVSGKPTTFPSDWDTTADKPTTFPPAATSGTWIPSMEMITPGGTVTYASRSGTWYRLADLIFLTARIALASFTAQTGRLVVRGLPVAPASGLEPNGNVTVANANDWVAVSNSTVGVFGAIRASIAADGFTFGKIRQGASQTGVTAMNWADVQQTFSVDFTAIYKV